MSPERAVLFLGPGLFQSVCSGPLPRDEDLFGLSSGLLALFDDLPDLSSRPLPGLLNTIIFYLALSQREGSKLRFFKQFFYFFVDVPNQRLKLLNHDFGH